MTTLNISLPDSMRLFIDKQIKQKGYSTASEYIRHLIRQEQEREEQKRLEFILLEGIDSGEPIEINEQWWENKRIEYVVRFERPLFALLLKNPSLTLTRHFVRQHIDRLLPYRAERKPKETKHVNG